MTEAAKIVQGEGTKPTTNPATNHWAIYPKTDGYYVEDDAGTEYPLGLATAARMSKLDGIEELADVTDATNVEAAGAVMDGDFSAAEGIMRKVSAGTYTTIKTNLAASVAPDADNDNTEGYGVGSPWIDTTADKAYVCLDATTATAVWTETTQSGGGGGGAAPFMFFPAESGIAHTATPSAFLTSANGSGILWFDDTTQESIVFTAAAHTSLGAGDLSVVIHWLSGTVTTGDAKWNVSIERGNTTLQSDSFASAQTGTTTVGGTVYVLTTTTIAFTIAEADAIEAGEPMRILLQADPGDAAHTIVGDVGVRLLTVAQ